MSQRGRRAVWRLPMVVMISTAIGCDGSPDDATVESTAGDTIVTTSTGAGDSSTAGAERPGVITPPPRPQPQPIDPAGVDFADAFEAFVGGGDSVPGCADLWQAAPSTPYIGAGDGTLGSLIRGLSFQICFAGFDATAPIELTVVDPSGAERVTTLTAAGSTDVVPGDLLVGSAGTVELQVLDGYLGTRIAQLDPATPLGQYRMIARQGDRQAEVTPTVENYPVNDPGGGRLFDEGWQQEVPLRAGDTRRILLLGFPANAAVPLAVYRPEGPPGVEVRFTFVQRLEDAMVNAEGWGYHDVVIPDGLSSIATLPGYCIVTVPALAGTYCQPYLDLMFTYTGEEAATTTSAMTDTSSVAEASSTTTTVLATTTTTTIETTTSSSATTGT